MIHLLVKVRYSWLKEIPNTWPLLVKHLEEYTPLNCCKVVTWKLSSRGGFFKCNTDGCSKGNPGLSAVTLCIRNDEGVEDFSWSSGCGEGDQLASFSSEKMKLHLET
ncbi:hypothetical protein H5410_038009 [Solanum commersonii]|uniref:RNase H type-1 domain-containing protein n=1 Tax=Solanum commersonii TaxID=4109 RepID=A0A9J5Y8U5_SOLCO|nr:hypothetical protein H5410_038009 [Solanum commersonii]